jgi:hypothetical protein
MSIIYLPQYAQTISRMEVAQVTAWISCLVALILLTTPPKYIFYET